MSTTGRRLSVVVAALTACSAVAVPGAALARSASAATWTKQAPPVSPPARDQASMAYDAANGTVVLFGGVNAADSYLGTTWTWDGSTWTQQFPKRTPSPRAGASMAYDTATGTVVLFSGFNSKFLNPVVPGTWTWG